MTATNAIKVGTVVFGQVNGYPPARWRYDGKRNGSLALTHLARGTQRPFPDQFVSRDDLERMARSE